MGKDFCFHLKLRQADRLLTSYYDAFLRDYGLKITQFSILRCLQYHTGSSHKDLEKLLILNQTTLTRNLQSLLKAGYVISEPSPEDRRIKRLRLSESGKVLYQDAVIRWKVAQDNVAVQLGEDLCSQLFDVSDSLLLLDPIDVRTI